jgi:hypothetical protein
MCANPAKKRPDLSRGLSHQGEVIAMLEKEGLDANDSKRLQAALVSARAKDLVEMDRALDELDKTKRYVTT